MSEHQSADAPRGEVVVTWDEYRTRILAVTRQNAEGEILSVIAEAPRLTAAEEAWCDRLANRVANAYNIGYSSDQDAPPTPDSITGSIRAAFIAGKASLAAPAGPAEAPPADDLLAHLRDLAEIFPGDVYAKAADRIKSDAARICALEAAICAHNDELQALCDDSARLGNCAPYVERGLRCPDCPCDYAIAPDSAATPQPDAER